VKADSFLNSFRKLCDFGQCAISIPSAIYSYQKGWYYCLGLMVALFFMSIIDYAKREA
jgi:hypothetical protein